MYLQALCAYTVVNGNVIGLDLGSDYMTVGLVQAGKSMEIVNNFQSQRKTPQAITFDRGERFFGSDSTGVMGRKPQKTFTKFNRLLGRTIDDPLVKAFDRQYFPYEIYSNTTDMGGRGHLCIKEGKDNYYTPEELTAMMIQHAKQITAKHGGQSVKDSVMTVPSFYTQHERRATQNAAEIADLRVLSLIEENTAVALYLGMERVFEKPYTVLFYNMGSTGTQVSIVTYSSIESKEKHGKPIGQFEVIGKGWDRTLGAFEFDVKLAELFAERFNDEWKKKKSYKEGDDIRLYNIPMTKLKLQANKVKEVLSANPEFPVRVEQLHANIDFSTKVTREEFQNAISNLLKRVTQPISDAINMAGIEKYHIHAVEMLGGGVRVPAVKKILEEFFTDVEVPEIVQEAETLAEEEEEEEEEEEVAAADAEVESGSEGAVVSEKKKSTTASAIVIPAHKIDIEVGQHLNGDESMALGAAFHAASLSSSFKVRKVGMTDISSWPIDMSLETLNMDIDTDIDVEAVEETKMETEVWRKETGLYGAKSQYSSKTKIVAVQHDKDIVCSLSYPDATPISDASAFVSSGAVLPEGASHLIAQYNITGISAFVKEHAEKNLGKPKIQMFFQLDGSGIVVLSKAEASLELPKLPEPEVESEVETGDAAADVTSTAVEEDAKFDDNGDPIPGPGPVSTDGGDVQGDNNGESKSTDTNNGTDADADKNKDPVDDDIDEKKSEKKTKAKSTLKKESAKAKAKKAKARKDKAKADNDRILRVSLQINENFHVLSPPGMTPEHIAESKLKLAELDEADNARRLREAAINELEQYILSVANRLREDEDILSTVSTVEQREDTISICRDIEDWLYDSEAKDAGVTEFNAKLKIVQKMARPIFDRYQESLNRPIALAKANKKLQDIHNKMENWTDTRPWISLEEKDHVEELITIAKEWLLEKTTEQNALEAHVSPLAFLSNEVPSHTRPVEAAFEKLRARKKPEPPKVQNNQTIPSDSNSTDADSSTLENTIEVNVEDLGETKIETNADSTKEGGEEAASGDDANIDANTNSDAAEQSEDKDEL